MADSQIRWIDSFRHPQPRPIHPTSTGCRYPVGANRPGCRPFCLGLQVTDTSRKPYKFMSKWLFSIFVLITALVLASERAVAQVVAVTLRLDTNVVSVGGNY